MIKLSQAAADEIQRLKSKQKQPNLLFRLAVKPGGCSGWFYDMSFNDEQAITDCDRVFACKDIQVVLDAKTLEHTQDLTIEYSEDLMGGGFRFYNPQAETVCSCGNSFSVSSTMTITNYQL
jgi:iron-sulfur cluster assembly accessory protein